MALPTTIVAGAGSGCYHPPFKASDGDFYVIVRNGANLDAYRATDPTDAWTIQDVDNNPINLGSGQRHAIVQDGDNLHIASSTGGAYRYNLFDMAASTWTVASEAIETPANLPANHWISIAVRSDGDVVVVYNGDTDQVMGSTKQRVDYNVRTVTTWGGPQALDNAAADEHYGNPNCVLGTNNFVHCLWQATANVTDPPTAWTDTIGGSIDPADDTLSTNDASDADTGGALLGFPNVISYDDGGTQRIIVSGFIADGTSLSTAQGTEQA